MQLRFGWLIPAVALFLISSNLCIAENTASPAHQTLAGKGLVKVGGFYLLDVDAHLAERLKEIHTAEAQLQAYTRQHDAIYNDIQHATRTLDDLETKQADIDAQLKQNGTAAWASYNVLVDQHNQIARQIRDGEAYLKRRTADLSSLVSPSAPVSQIISLADDMQAAASRYTALAADDDVKKAIDSLNAAGPHVKLGPSGLFSQQLPILRHQHDVNMKAAIKGTLLDGTLQVNVTLNKHAGIPMIVDSGCSTLLLTAEAAHQAGVEIKPGSPTVTATIANGEQVTEQTAVVQTLTLGQYTLKDVPCTILPRGVGRDCLLGGTFLQHFLYQIDLNTGELRLTPAGTDVNVAADPTAGNSEPATQPAVAANPSSGKTFELKIETTVDTHEEFIINADGISLKHGKGKQPVLSINGQRWDAVTEKTFPARNELAALRQVDIAAGKSVYKSGRGNFSITSEDDGLHVLITDGFPGVGDHSITLSFPLKN